MGSRFQACALVSPPTFPNAIAWSEENLIAVATGHIVTILNPALPCGPRGVIMLPAAKPFQIDLIERKDLSAPGMLPVCLSRNSDRPCVRSISWSPIGMAPNSGCLLAVCTIEGQVKLYRSPYCEFQSEWVEVADVAEILFNRLSEISFKEIDTASSVAPDEDATHPSQMQASDGSLPLKMPQKRVRNKDSEPSGGINKFFKPVEIPFPSQHVNLENRNVDMTFLADESVSNATQMEIIRWHNINENYPKNIVPRKRKKQVNGEKVSFAGENMSTSRRAAPKSSAGPSISAEEYISRNAMLSPIIVAWSPLICSSTSVDIYSRFSLLAVGGKSGKASFWRVQEPQSYSVSNHGCSTSTMFAGFLHAHNAWITAISWVIVGDDHSKDQVVLVTGSAEGSVKIWLQHENKLLSEDGQVSLNLVTEIAAADCSSVSALSVAVPVKSLDKLLIAVGKASGTFDVWTCNLVLKIFNKIGTYDTHDHVITGLAWAFGGRCLYSCSQDNSFRSWILREGSLCEAGIPSNTLGICSSKNIPNASDSSFGIAISPGNMVLAMARSFDTSLLDQMYQARCLKGAVEFFWIGGQEVEPLLDTHRKINLDASSEFSEKELLHWSTNMLLSLKLLEDPNTSLVMWDVVAALLAFKHSIPKYVDYFLFRWLKTILSVPNVSRSLDEILTLAATRLRTCSCRQLHILNIIGRRIVLSESKVEEEVSNYSDQDFLPLWIELLSSIEREIRERLVGSSLSAASVLMPCSSRNSLRTEIWRPLGLAQMEQWVAVNDHLVSDKLKLLASEAGQFINRANRSGDYVQLEKCPFCSASVAFESSEVANCQIESPNGEADRHHKLERCAVSMRVCPSTPLWYCVCCNRRAFTTAPVEFFRMARHHVSYDASSSMKCPSKPLCPFCGLLQQRQQPAFLLSPSPV